MYGVIRDGQVDAISAFSTDGRLGVRRAALEAQEPPTEYEAIG